MDEDKRKWIRFEEGLLWNGFAMQNQKSYWRFRKECCEGKEVGMRQAILIFLGVNQNGNRKSFSQSIINDIMQSRNLNHLSGEGRFTISVIKSEDSDLNNSAYAGPNTEIIDDKTEINVKNSIEFLKNDKRIIDCRKKTLFEKMILGVHYLKHDLQSLVNVSRKLRSLLIINYLLEYWFIILPALYIGMYYIKSGILKTNVVVMLICGVICRLIYMYVQDALKSVMGEIEYYRNLNYPIIFFNETGKTRKWMREYMQKYLDGEEGEKPTKSVFYIGANDFDVGEKLNVFVIPQEYLEWGWICLCKLVRDLSDNPWGKVRIRSDIENYRHQSIENRNHYSFKKIGESDFASKKERTFRLWDEEGILENEEAKLDNIFCNFCRISNWPEEGNFWPIGNSVYMIFKYVDWGDEKVELIKNEIKEGIERIVENFEHSPQFVFWIIKVDKEEQKVIDGLYEMINESDRGENIDESLMDLWKEMMQTIVEELKQNEFNFLNKVYAYRQENYKNLSIYKFAILFSDIRNDDLAKALRKEK